MRNFTFRKRLIAFAVSAFACLGANAYSFDGNALVVTPGDVQSGSSFINGIANEMPHQGVTTIKLVGTFTTWEGNWLGDNGDKNSKKGITTIDLSQANLSAFKTTSWKFSNFTDLTTITWPSAEHADYISVIPGFAFKNNGITSITIPGYIKEIQNQAFDSDSGDKYLNTIIFEEYDADNDGKSDVVMEIARQAFSNTAGLVDVYIEAEGTLTAENNAFPEVVTYGQGDIGRNLTRLHFPEDKATLYVNQDHKLTEAIASNDKDFQKWLVDHYSLAGEATNGFYEFVSNGSSPKDDEKDWGDVVLRTFSHPTIDYVVPKGAKAYIVNKVLKDGDIYRMKLKKVNVIPHGTGVILYGGTNSKTRSGNKTLEMMAVVYEGNAYTRFDENGNELNIDDEYRNLLVSTSSADEAGNPTMDGVDVEPYEVENGVVAYRNFYMGMFSATNSGKSYYKKHKNYGTYDSREGGKTNGDFVGFFRAKSSARTGQQVSSRKAYLRVPATEFDNPEGGEIVVPADVPAYRAEFKAGQAVDLYNEDEMKAKGYWYKSNDDKILWTDDWGVRNLASGFSMAKFSGEPVFQIDEEEDGVVTLIVPGSMIDVEEAGDYYNLQGVKVSHPTKGIYVKNGKKVVIK